MWLGTFVVYVQISAFTGSKPIYHHVNRFSSLLMHGYNAGSISDLSVIEWYFLGRLKNVTLVQQDISAMFVQIDPLYEQRVNYNAQTTSLKMLNFKMTDSGVYLIKFNFKNSKIGTQHISHFVQVHEILQQPVIIQNGMLAVTDVRLNCIVGNDLTAIWWLKKGQPLQSDETYKISNNNTTLTINTKQPESCELYTCVVRNMVNQKEDSLLLAVDGLLVLHELSLMSSILALISTTTSFAACCFIIFFALKNHRVHKRHIELTAAFMLFQMLAFIFLLFAAMFCIIDPKHHYFFLVYGVFSIIFSVVPIHRGQKNITECQVPVNYISGTIGAIVVIYVFIVGVPFIFFLKYMMTWHPVQRLTRLASRS
ncbi:SLAM family member 9-like isoform X2 [Scyliorhinus canicula]|uniref:SLAM family member 9-like isoform X2 n=1 Tax=Scyliorhinus canicula TaxID=7830 RepID=UPI0018F52D38|nr:SLAM family member 9-like isoform X2 [Scyliorhinus canicula]